MNTMRLTERQYLPEDVYAVKAISRISSTGSVRIISTYMSGLTLTLNGWVGGRDHTRKWENYSHP